MVNALKTIKQIALICILCFLVMSTQVFAASFKASTDRSAVTAGESFLLELSLSGTSPKGRPDFSPLEKDFTIASNRQSSQTSIINNRISSSISWQLVLIAPKLGSYTIPSISIDTDEGKLKSNPLEINVDKVSQTDNTNAPKRLSVTAEVSKKSPYQNEPVLYKVKLIATKSIADIGISEFNMSDAIVEKQGDAKVYDTQHQGKPVKVVEANYLITPLKSGALKIPAYVFQGQVESVVQNQHPNSLSNDPFFDMSDPFGMLDNFRGFTTYNPFTIASEEIELNVKPPAANIDPWLPLNSLEIADKLEGLEGAKVGEPLTLTLRITAEGAIGSVLPNLEEQITLGNSFKIYADRPEIGESTGDDGKTVSGWREERYALIPQKSGILTLPEIKVPWWDVNADKIVYTTVAPRQIEIVSDGLPLQLDTQDPASETAKPEPLSQAVAAQQTIPLDQETASTNIIEQNDLPNHIYILLSVAVGIIAVLLIAVFYLWRIVIKQKKTEKRSLHPIKSTNKANIQASAIESVETLEGLKGFLQTFANQHWNTPPNASFTTILASLKKHNPHSVTPKIEKLFSDLDAALYAGGKVDLEQCKNTFLEFLKSTITNKNYSKVKVQKLEMINPS